MNPMTKKATPEIELISSENFSEMKEKIIGLGRKISEGTATNGETQFVRDIITNTNDYSDILALDMSNTVDAEAGIKMMNYIIRTQSKGIRILELSVYNRQINKELSDYFKMLEKSLENKREFLLKHRQ